MIWFYIIALILYIIGFTLRSCLYRTITNSWRTVDLAKEDPSHRYKKKIPIWQLFLFVFVYFIPIVNIFGGCISIAWGMADDDSEFYLWEENALSRLFGKIYNFLTKSAW